MTRTLLTIFSGILWFDVTAAEASSRWTHRASGTNANLWGLALGRDVDAATSERWVVAVGEQGTILNSSDGGITWVRRESGTDVWLTAVGHFHFGGTVRRWIAVGDRGTVLSSPDGSTWTREPTPTTTRLNTIVPGRDDATAYAFGEAGAAWLIRDVNEVWSQQSAPFADRWMRGFGNGVLVGERGTIFELQDTELGPSEQLEWRPMISPSSSDLEAIAVGSPPVLTQSPGSSIVAVGANGTIVQRVSEGWVTRSSGITETLRGVTSKSGGTVTLVTNTLRVDLREFFAVGTNGTILRSANGVTWQKDPVPTQRNLNMVLATPNGIIAVGDGGTILTLDADGAAPVVVRQPVISHDAAGRPYVEAEATGDGVLTYLWVALTAGAPWFVGSAGPTQTLESQPPLPVVSPIYQLVVGNAFGITRSDPVASHRITNLSTLAHAGTGDGTLISGFSLATNSPVTTRPILIRAVGPGLHGFGFNRPLEAPRLSIYVGDRSIATNTGWHTAANADEFRATAARYGAFPLAEKSSDSGLLLQLGTGNYTAVIDSADGISGAVLLEVYDAAPATLTRLANLSARADVRAGESAVVGGLVVTGGLKKNLLIRAAGPALRAFGIENVLSQPEVIVRKETAIVATGTAWHRASNSDAIRRAAERLRAFQFDEGSADAALSLELSPGAYTIEVRGADGGSGLTLLEIYDQ